MKRKFFFVLLITPLLAACSAGQAPIQSNLVATEPPVSVPTQLTDSDQTPGKSDSVTEATDLPATIIALPTATSTPKPALEKDAWKQMPALPTEISDAMREVYQRGLALGNDPTRFSIIGDCQNVSSYFLAVFEKPGEFSLGAEYAYLQPTIDYFQGSYSRQSLAVKGGFNAAAVLSPLRADPKSCNPNESPLDCELRTWRPSIVFVSMETWWSEKPEQEYDKYMRRVIERILETGAVPIIATKADNLEGDHGINATIAQIAYDYDIPLWNFWAVVQPLPNHGLSSDNFHLTFARNFFDDPVRMKSAWPWRNLTALQTLDVVHAGLTGQP
jgi:hypothetical protein